jgi:hypothetical protein
MPSASWGMPNVRRACPVSGSSPTSPIVRPIASDAKPRTRELPSTDVTATNANTMIAKKSGAPMSTATDATSGASSTSPSAPARPPMKCPIAAVARAWAPRPERAIGLPSIAAITDALSPGVLSRIDVVDPPNMAPK